MCNVCIVAADMGEKIEISKRYQQKTSIHTSKNTRTTINERLNTLPSCGITHFQIKLNFTASVPDYVVGILLSMVVFTLLFSQLNYFGAAPSNIILFVWFSALCFSFFCWILGFSDLHCFFIFLSLSGFFLYCYTSFQLSIFSSSSPSKNLW